jgi:tRNA(Glu) U13 pseudouridine synthase TruD
MSFLLEQQYACLSPPRYLEVLVAKLIISLLRMFAQADTKYLWNRLLLEELIENKLEPFILPVIQGNILFMLLRQ